jgi:hypothetical protein
VARPRATGARGRLAALWTTLLVRDAPRLRELLVAGTVFAIASVVLLWEHIHESGFYSDDWSYRAIWVQWEGEGEGFWGRMGNLIDAGPLQGRPTLAVYLSLVQQAFGSRQGAHLAWAAVLAVLFSVCVYLLLRMLRFRRLDAGLIGLLVLVFPASDSTRIWAMISDAQVAMSLAFLGVAAGLRAVSATGRRAVLWKALSVVLMVLGVTTYELTFVALLCSFLLYRTRVPWKRALRHGVVDWVALGLTYLLVLSNSTAERQTLSDTIDHGWVVFKETFEVFATTALPFDSVGAALTVAGLVLIAALLVRRTLAADDPAKAAMTRWLWTVAIGVALIAAAYVIYAPASAIYRPMAPGLMNRTNALGAVPMIVVVYALGALLALMAFRTLPNGRSWAVAGAAVLAIAVGVDYTSGITRNLKLWDSAYARAGGTLYVMRKALPEPPPKQSLIVVFGQPVEEAPGIPVWAHYWDFDGAVRLHYRDTTLRGRPAFPGTVIQCDRESAKLTNTMYAGVVLPTDDARYGYFYMLDGNTGALAIPRNRRECRQMAPSFVPGPFHPADPGAKDPG